MRMQIRRFTRLTNGFSKKFEDHWAALALWFAFYNFCRIHSSIRVTPATEADGVSPITFGARGTASVNELEFNFLANTTRYWLGITVSIPVEVQYMTPAPHLRQVRVKRSFGAATTSRSQYSSGT